MFRRLLAFGALAGLLLAFTPQAGALTFCAGLAGGDCSATYPATGDGVQQALSAADIDLNIDNSPNTVRIGAGTFTRAAGQQYLVRSPVIVIGQGPATVLAASPSSGGAINDAFLAQGQRSTLRDLVVRVAGTAFAGVSGFATVADVRVTGDGPTMYPVFLPAGGRGTRLLIDPPTIQAYGGGALIKSGAVLEDSVIRVRGANTRGVVVSDDASTLHPAVVRHVTILGNAETGTTGVSVSVPRGSTTPRAATANVRDSVIRGVARALARTGEAATALCAPCTTGTANLDVRYSSWDPAPAARADTGPGTFTVGPGNLANPDPLFADIAGDDLRLRPGSPLIDAGDPAAPEAGDSLTDAGGSPRIANARRDIGAFEAAVVVPPAPAPATPGPALPDVTAPLVSGAKLSRSTFRVGPASTALVAAGRTARRPGRGTTLTYALSEAATVTFTVERELGGWSVVKQGAGARVCRRPTKGQRSRGAKRCTLRRTAGVLTRTGAAGTNTLAFSGRIGRKRLPAGRYRLTIIARDAVGNAGSPKRLAFRIVT